MAKGEITVSISIKEAMPDVAEAILALNEVTERFRLLVDRVDRGWDSWDYRDYKEDAAALQRAEAILEKLRDNKEVKS